MIILFCGCTSSPDNSNIPDNHENTTVLNTIDELDSAIRAATDNLNERVQHGQVIAIISITSSHITLSEYIFSELNSYIISDNLFYLVDRHQLDAIRMEQNFQLSGEVSDESAQSIGRILGAQTIITGAINQLGDMWRMQLRALEVQSARVLVQSNRNIATSFLIDNLILSGMPPNGATQAVQQPSTPEGGLAASLPEQFIVYELGENGPAGGIVFYDKGSYSNGWRYMEVSPVTLRSDSFGPYGLYIPGTEEALGSGRSNTEILVRILDRRGERNMAAQVANNYSLNGFNDWFLPSKQELEHLYAYAYDNRMNSSAFDLHWWFYSSSQIDNDNAWGINFSNGYIGPYRNGSGMSGPNVRAIRYF